MGSVEAVCALTHLIPREENELEKEVHSVQTVDANEGEEWLP